MTNQEELVEQKDLNTLVDCMNTLFRKGFTENYKANDKGLQALSTKHHYKPGEVKILNFYRFEGYSDPADNSILYALETNDGQRGTLVDAYGPYADSNVSKFIHEIEEVNKKTDRDAEI